MKLHGNSKCIKALIREFGDIVVASSISGPGVQTVETGKGK